MLTMPSRVRKRLLGILILPLLSLGTCSTIAIESSLDGFFNAVIPFLDDQLAARLADHYGTTAGDTGGTGTNDPTGSSGTPAS